MTKACGFQYYLAITEDESERLFKRLECEEISVFFIKAPIEMGTVGKKAN